MIPFTIVFFFISHGHQNDPGLNEKRKALVTTLDYHKTFLEERGSIPDGGGGGVDEDRHLLTILVTFLTLVERPEARAAEDLEELGGEIGRAHV